MRYTHTHRHTSTHTNAYTPPPDYNMFSFQPQEYTLKEERPRIFNNNFTAIDEGAVPPDLSLEPPQMVHAHEKADSTHSIQSADSLFSNRLRRYNSASSVASSTMSVSMSPTPSFGALKKVAKFPLQAGVTLVSNDESATMLQESSCCVVDVRPFTEFNAGHLKHSINLNIPSTLLKRQNFTLQKCLGNITLTDSLKLSTFLRDDQILYKKLLFYDQSEVLNGEVPLSLYGSINKFIQDPECDAQLYILTSGYHSFKLEHQDLIESTPVATKPPLTPHNRSLSLANISTSSTPSSSMISPNLSRFHLPKLPLTPVFKIRHNEETYENEDYRPLHEFKFLSRALQHDLCTSSSPAWLTELFTPKRSNALLMNKFKSLEIEERNRINSLIQTNSVGSGIELGFKNRYKDIFPYEHSRVKLVQTPINDTANECLMEENPDEYINANFVNVVKFSKMRYIATQAPLESTTREFAKLVKDNNVDVVISLTSQFENGVEKCFPYWNDLQNFTLLETESLGDIVLRRLKSLKYGNELMQVQLTNWTDFDVLNDSGQMDIFKLIYLKNIIGKELGGCEKNVIVHCSAGCGRTGTFCALDSIIESTFIPEATSSSSFDPIYETVECFRNQRISMVQNLRQYLFIYDCLLNYYENHNGFREESFKELGGLTILKNFYNEKGR